jgi:hypothetical protein
MKKYIIWMIIGCGLPLLLIFLAPALGLGSGTSLFIFIMVQNYVTREDEAARKKVHELLIEVYESLPYPLVHVPVLPPEERVNFILKNL